MSIYCPAHDIYMYIFDQFHVNNILHTPPHKKKKKVKKQGYKVFENRA